MIGYKFQIGDEVKILPEVKGWVYCSNLMQDYIGLTARIIGIENCEGLHINSGYRVWLDVDNHEYFWNPDYLELVLPVVELDETTLSNLL